MLGFYSDQDHTLSIEALELFGVPAEVVHAFISEAERRMPPAPDEAADAATSTI
jgi:hypothetical protein